MTPMPAATLRRNIALFWIGLALMAALAAGGWVFVMLVARAGSNLEEESLASIAAIAATSVDPAVVGALQGNRNDTSSPAFAAVRDQLKKIHDRLPTARFAHLMGQRQGGVFVLADGQDPSSPDYSPPGQPYPDASPELRRVFAEAKPVVGIPYRDSRGEWVSSLAPVMDPATGKVVAVLGFDVPANHWREQVGSYRSFAGAIVGFLATIFIVALYIQARSQRRISLLNDQLKADVDELEKSNRIVEQSSTVLFRMTAEKSWPLTYVSRNIERYGHRAEEVLGPLATWLALFHPEDQPVIRDNLEQLMAGTTSVVRSQSRFRKGDNSWAWVDASLSAVRDPEGRLVAGEGLMFDITETKKAEDRIAYLASHDGVTGLSN